MTRRHPFTAVNFISDPIHGYVELTKRLTPDESAFAGLPTGFHDLDTLMSGLQPGNLIVVAARPGVRVFLRRKSQGAARATRSPLLQSG